MDGRFVKRPYGFVRNLSFSVSPLRRLASSPQNIRWMFFGVEPDLREGNALGVGVS